MLYIDIYFFINVVMDYLILFLVWKIGHLNSGYLRILLAAVSGGIWACVVVIKSDNNLLFWFMSYIGICLIMCKIAFRVKGLKNTLVSVIGVYLVTWLLGGCLNAVYYYTMAGYYVEQFLYGKVILISGEWLFLISFLMGAALLIIIKLYRIFIIKKGIFYKVILYNKEFIIEVDALLDTGNRLWYHNQAVSLIEWELAKKMLDDNVLQILNSYFFGMDCMNLENKNNEADNLQNSEIDNLVSNYIKKDNIEYNKGGDVKSKESDNILWIPYKSVGKENGVLPAVIIDEIVVKKNNKSDKKSHIIVGVVNQRFSENNKYQMIIHQNHVSKIVV